MTQKNGYYWGTGRRKTAVARVRLKEGNGRIIVNGNPQYLQNERTTDWIRTLLLAGIRAATLWSQLGGGRFDLMFGRKKIQRDARTFLIG